VGFTSSRRVDPQARAYNGWGEALRAHRGLGSGSTAGQAVTRNSVATIPAIHRAWSFAANAVAALTLGVWRGEGVIPERVTNTPQARLFAGVPNERQDWYRFKYTVQKSLEARNSGYVWKTKTASGQVTALTALHPDQVFPQPTIGRSRELTYAVVFQPGYPLPPEVDGYGMLTVDRSTIWHIRGDGGLGEDVPATPITTFAATLGIALAKQDYEANLYEHGVMGGLNVSFPEKVTPEQAAKWKALYDSDNAGTGNTGRTKVTGGGATLAQIGMTQKDAQFVEAGVMTMQDICNITGVPAWVLNIGDKQAKASTPEQDDARWVHHGLEIRLRRIEASLYADADIFGPGSRDYPMFDTAGAIHPDSLTADTIAHSRVQDGRMLVDEWRVPMGLPPLPGGVGKIPQITPVGAAPNPALKPTPVADDDGED
jgi:HK97 family phage portal protein